MVDPRTDSLIGIAKLPLLQLLQSTPYSVSVPAIHPQDGASGQQREQQRIERRLFGAQVPVVSIPVDGVPSAADA